LFTQNFVKLKFRFSLRSLRITLFFFFFIIIFFFFFFFFFVSLHFLHLRKSVGRLGRGITPSQGRFLAQTQDKHKQTSIPWVWFEPTIAVFERAKTFDA
jgi:hypothetical protein